MSIAKVTVLGAAVLLAAAAVASAQELAATVPDPAKGYKWQDAARQYGFDDKSLEALSKQKVLVTGDTYKQIFTPYISSIVPLFITSDSLLNAYHVLYEESVLRVEMTNAYRLPVLLRHIWDRLEKADAGLTGNPELSAGAKRRAQVVIATALRLTGDTEIRPSAEVAALVDKEVEKITAASVTEKPAWLGPPDEGFLALDYSRFKPRGFYAKRPLMQRYFRAVSWLQAIPFRTDHDEELLALEMLAHTLTPGRIRFSDGSNLDPLEFLCGLEELVGPADDWSLAVASHWPNEGLKMELNQATLDLMRRVLVGYAERCRPRAKINDQIAMPPADPKAVAEPQFRILSAHRTPDGVLFQRTTDLREFAGEFARPFPTGLEVAAALGSPFAADRLTGKNRDKVLQKIAETKPEFSGGTSHNPR